MGTTERDDDRAKLPSTLQPRTCLLAVPCVLSAPHVISKSARCHTHTHRLVYLPTARMCVCVSEHVDFVISAEHDRSIHTYSSVQLQLNQAQNNHSAAHTNILTQRSVVAGGGAEGEGEDFGRLDYAPGFTAGRCARFAWLCCVFCVCALVWGWQKHSWHAASADTLQNAVHHKRTAYVSERVCMCVCL